MWFSLMRRDLFNHLLWSVFWDHILISDSFVHYSDRKYIDRVPYFHKSHFSLILQIYQLLSFLQHPVTILVTDFTNPDNLTDDLIILNYLVIKLNIAFIKVGGVGIVMRAQGPNAQRSFSTAVIIYYHETMQYSSLCKPSYKI